MIRKIFEVENASSFREILEKYYMGNEDMEITVQSPTDLIKQYVITV